MCQPAGSGSASKLPKNTNGAAASLTIFCATIRTDFGQVSLSLSFDRQMPA
jgi:hypothetical protein